MFQTSNQSLAVATTLVVGVAAYLWISHRRKKREWVKVGEVAELWMYPVKSCHGFKVANAELTSVGMKYKGLRDRTFVIVDDAGNHANCKTNHPIVVTIRAEEVPEEHEKVAVKLSAPGMDPCIVAVEDSQKKTVNIKLFGEYDVKGWDMGDNVAKWLHRYITGEDVSSGESAKYRFFYYNEGSETVRTSRDRKKPYIELARVDDKITLTDFSALHIMCESSLSDLNRRLGEVQEKPLNSSHFRSNIFVKNSSAYEEDQWKFVKIGDSLLRVVKPTQRCVMMTLNYEDGTKNPKSEPLKTLRKYRVAKTKQEREYFKDSPLIGINLAVDKGGDIRVGDPIYAVL